MDHSTLKSLRKLSHHLKPVVWLGQNGYTDAVAEEIERALDVHQLIKLKLAGSDKAARGELTQQITDKHAAHTVQQIGGMLAIYRRNPDRPALTEN